MARAKDVAAVGIDAEPNEPLPASVEESIARPAEAAQIRRLEKQCPDIHWDRLLFSAKECVYKAWFPLARTELDFTDAQISFRPDGSFTADLLGRRLPAPNFTRMQQRPGVLAGQWLSRHGLLITAIIQPTSECSGQDM